MTIAPVIDLLKRARAEYKVLSYSYDPRVSSYGPEAAERLGLDPQRVFKTLLAATEKGELLVTVVPAIGSLNLKALVHATGARKADMADPQAAQRATGYLVGGINPLGWKKRLRIFVDESARQYLSIHVSAGRHGLEMELATEMLAQLAQGSFAAIGRE